MRFKSILSGLFFGVTILAAGAYAANVTGTISAANNNWGTGGNVASPVAITGNITVPAGVTLTIQPGCVITGAYTVTVNGTLNVNGTIDQYVDWSAAKMVFAAGSGLSTLRFIKIISYTSPNVIFPNAVDVNGGNVDFEHVEIQDFGTYGISVNDAASVVKINFCTIGAKSRTFNTTLGVATSLNIGAAAAHVTVSNSILGVEENTQMKGVNITGTATNTAISYTFIAGASTLTGAVQTNNYLNVTPGIFDIPNIRFFLADLAPAVDAADPADAGFANEPTPNGGRTDCGYYGGTSQATKSQLQMRVPAAEQSLTHGTQIKVSWWGGRFACTKKVDYSTDSGANWTTINAAVPVGDTSVMWTVPNVKTGRGLIRVAYTTVNNVIGVSGRFYIDSIPPVHIVCDPNKVLVNPKYFACIPYAGYRTGQAPGGAEPTYVQVQQDMVLLSHYTHGIRTYGTDWRNNNNIGQDFIPHFCDSLNMNLYMGIWLDDPYGDATNYANCDKAITVVNQNHKSIKSVIVGNEYLLRVEQAHGNLVTAEANLVKYINYVKSHLPAGSAIKVSTGESYPDWLLASNALPQAVDVVYWHVHPWWEGKAITVAAEWAKTAHQKMLTRLAQAGVNKPMVLAETGYPWGATQGAAVGTEANQAQYLHDLHAYAFSVGLQYWFFEGFDEPWKASMEGGVGDKWGLWKLDHTTPHQVVTTAGLAAEIPDCMMWEDPEVPTSVNDSRRGIPNFSSPAASNYTEIRVYTVQGRLIAKVPAASNGAAHVKRLIASRKLAAGNVFVVHYVNNGTTIRAEKISVR
jgi:exo-beta-1,3-glucanase (GH17 family)